MDHVQQCLGCDDPILNGEYCTTCEAEHYGRIRPLDILLYADRHDWIQVPVVRKRLFLFKHRYQPLRQIAVPDDIEDPGWPEALHETVQRFAELEQRPTEAVLTELVGAFREKMHLESQLQAAVRHACYDLAFSAEVRDALGLYSAQLANNTAIDDKEDPWLREPKHATHRKLLAGLLLAISHGIRDAKRQRP